MTFSVNDVDVLMYANEGIMLNVGMVRRGVICTWVLLLIAPVIASVTDEDALITDIWQLFVLHILRLTVYGGRLNV